MRVLIVLSLFIAGCAALEDPVIREAREHVAAGRGEQALALLDSKPNYRHEYFRTRDLLVAQWLSQADMLRQNDRPDAAAELYRRAQKYDAANARARAGLEQLELDARHRLVIAAAERLAKDEK